MKSKTVPTFQALGWGFRELLGHLPVLLPMSTLFFAPEISERFKFGWPIWATEIYKTVFFFVLLLKAMKLTKTEEETPARGKTSAFALGECIKSLTQIVGFAIGCVVLGAWLMYRDPSFFVSLLQGGGTQQDWIERGTDLWHWWLHEPGWEKALTLLMIGWLPLRAHVFFNFFGYIVAEKGSNAIEALRQSVRLGRGVQFQLLFFYGLCFALNFVGFKLFIVGAILTFPATVLATVDVYRSLARQENL
jgi:hypothetical protein